MQHGELNKNNKTYSSAIKAVKRIVNWLKLIGRICGDWAKSQTQAHPQFSPASMCLLVCMLLKLIC